MVKWFLSLENFKSIRQLERLEGRPITLLVGSNNAGKTSVLQALLLLKGSLAYPEVVLSFRNDLVDMGSFQDTVTKGHDEEGISIKLGEEGDRGAWSFFLRVDTLEGTLQIRGCDVVSKESRFSYRRPLSSEEPTATFSDLREGVLGGREAIEGLRWRSFLPSFHIHGRRRPRVDRWEAQQFLDLIQYIGPLRVYPQRSYPRQPPPTPDVGIDGRWAPYLLRKANKDQLQDLRRWLGPEGFGLVKDLRVRDVEDLPEFVVEVNIQRRWVNLRDVGFGMSQLLPTVVESIFAPAMSWHRSSLLLLEQPEIHLHPKAQADLGTFIAEMAQKGRHYLIETHSEYLVMRLATEVRRGHLSPDDIAICFLSLDEQGHTQFRHIPLGEDGRLPPPEEWPEGFFDTNIEEADAFLFASLERAEA
jgi:predicted ATPase